MKGCASGPQPADEISNSRGCWEKVSVSHQTGAMGNLDETISAISAEWELETGFLGILHYAVFDVPSSERFLDELRAVPAQTDDLIRRDLVRLLWMIPQVLNHQRGYVEDADGRPLALLIAAVENELTRIFGMP
jgi:hypothetical protein